MGGSKPNRNLYLPILPILGSFKRTVPLVLLVSFVRLVRLEPIRMLFGRLPLKADMLEETFEKQRILKELELQPTDAAIQHFAVRRNSKVFIEEDCPNKSTTPDETFEKQRILKELEL